MSWTKACPANIPPGECKGVVVNGANVAVFNVGGSFHATSNICTHQFALLSEGYVDGDVIECPLHQGRFSILTGEPEGEPVSKPIRVFPIRVEGGDVFVDVESQGG